MPFAFNQNSNAGGGGGAVASVFGRTGAVVAVAGDYAALTETLTNKTLTAPTINGGTATAMTGFSLRSTGAAFNLTMATAEVLTAGRTLSWVLGDAARTLTVPATGTLALLDTANVFTTLQTIAQASANTGILASTGYSLTGSSAVSMLNFSGTWNTSGTPTAFKVNITDTASGSVSNLMDLQIGGVSKFLARKDGYVFAVGYSGINQNTAFIDGAGITLGLNVGNTNAVSFSSTANWYGAKDIYLLRDAAAVLATRNSTTAQTWRVYTTWTDGSNGEWIETGSASSVPYIAATKNGTGTQRALNLQRVATPAAGSSSAAVLLGTTAAFGIYYGSGAPTVSAAQGSLYLRSDGSGIGNRLYVNTDGATTWTNFVTAA